MQVGLRNDTTGEVKTLTVGFSWTLFLFSNVLGIPLFIRKLYAFGGIMAGIGVMRLMATYSIEDSDLLWIVSIVLFGLGFGIALYLGMKGNELTAKKLLSDGWVWSVPDSEQTDNAKRTWGIA
jgi:hypothetical protein